MPPIFQVLKCLSHSAECNLGISGNLSVCRIQEMRLAQEDKNDSQSCSIHCLGSIAALNSGGFGLPVM